MKRIIIPALAAVILVLALGQAQALTIDVLDKVNIDTPKSKVVEILGQPSYIGPVGHGLYAEIYVIVSLPPLNGSGLIYDRDDTVAGHALIFEGRTGKQTVERLVTLGFNLLENNPGVWRLEGKDDDTTIPVVVTVSENDSMTSVIYLEKNFFEKNMKSN